MVQAQVVVGAAWQDKRAMAEMGELACLARVAMEEQEGTPIPEERALGELEGMGVQDKVVIQDAGAMEVRERMGGEEVVGMEEMVDRAAQSSSSPVRVLLFPEQSPEDLLDTLAAGVMGRVGIVGAGDRRGRKMQAGPQERGGKAASMRTKRRVPITGPMAASMEVIPATMERVVRGIQKLPLMVALGLTEAPVPDRIFQNSTFKPCKPS